MKKVSIFKSICWFFACFTIFILIDTIFYDISMFILSWLSNHLSIVSGLLGITIVFHLVILSITSECGHLSANIMALIFPKTSPNVGKAYFGCGIALIIFGFIVVIRSIQEGSLFLEVSGISGGITLILLGKTIDEANNNGELSEYDNRKTEERIAYYNKEFQKRFREYKHPYTGKHITSVQEYVDAVNSQDKGKCIVSQETLSIKKLNKFFKDTFDGCNGKTIHNMDDYLKALDEQLQKNNE